MSVGSSRSHTAFLLLLLHASIFLLLRFTLGFGVYLFAIGVCIFVCYFLLYFCFLIYARAQYALSLFLLSSSSLTYALGFFLSFLLLPPTHACLARVSAVSFLCNNFSHVSCTTFCCNLHRFALPTQHSSRSTNNNKKKRKRLPLSIRIREPNTTAE